MNFLSVDKFCVFGWPKQSFNPLTNYTLLLKTEHKGDIIKRFAIIVAIIVIIFLLTLLAAIYMKCA